MTDDTQLFFQDEDGKVITKSQLEELISGLVKKAYSDHCRFPVSDDQAKEASHIFGMVTDVGDGDLSKGVEEMRKNHNYVKKLRDKGDKFSTYFFMIIIAALTGGVLKSIWEGLKSLATAATK